MDKQHTMSHNIVQTFKNGQVQVRTTNNAPIASRSCEQAIAK
jgi:hypothetical protein